MKRAIILFMAVAGLSAVGSLEVQASNQSLIYRKFREDSGEITHKTYVTREQLPSGQTKILEKIEGKGGDCAGNFILDKKYQTEHWARQCAAEDTQYTGQKKGKTLFIKGRLKGVPVDRIIPLDDKPYYDDPRFNLTYFILSENKTIYFWTLRRDKLAKVRMEAKKRGEETLLINGKTIPVVRVHCAAAGLADKYYAHIYYFRKSDGLFVKESASTGVGVDLISEK